MTRLWLTLRRLLDGAPLDEAARVAAYSRVLVAPVDGATGHRLTYAGRPDADRLKLALAIAHHARLLHELRPGDEGVLRGAEPVRAKRVRRARVVEMAARRSA